VSGDEKRGAVLEVLVDANGVPLTAAEIADRLRVLGHIRGNGTGAGTSVGSYISDLRVLGLVERAGKVIKSRQPWAPTGLGVATVRDARVSR
jgi:hypothetical protein